MPTTPTYALPYQGLTDAPDGPNLGEDLALAIEAQLVRVDAAAAAKAGHVDGISNAGASGTTVSAVYANIPGTSSVAFTKGDAASRLKISGSISCQAIGATGELMVGVRVNGVDYDAGGFSFATTTAGHAPVKFSKYVTGLAVGLYTVQIRWKRTGGAVTVTMDAFDWTILDVEEVQ